VELERAVEDEKWVDEGTTRFEKRKAEQEMKKRMEQQKKAERKALEEKDNEVLLSSLKAKPAKVTAYQLEQQKQRSYAEMKKQQERMEQEKQKIINQDVLAETPNINQQMAKLREEEAERFGGAENIVDVSGVDAAIDELAKKFDTLSSSSAASGEVDRHPGRRVKAAYAAYETREMPILKAEMPTLKHSQLKQLLWVRFQKSPQNPYNIALQQQQAAEARGS